MGIPCGSCKVQVQKKRVRKKDVREMIKEKRRIPCLELSHGGGQELARSKFLIGACQHACACLQCFVVLQPCSAADTVLSEENKDLDLCVLSPTTKVRIEEEEGSLR